MTERSTVTTSPYTIGVAPFRPGDEPSFGGAFVEQPGDLNRPDPATCSAEDTAPHAKGLIRVLSDEGQALANGTQTSTLRPSFRALNT